MCDQLWPDISCMTRYNLYDQTWSILPQNIESVLNEMSNPVTPVTQSSYSSYLIQLLQLPTPVTPVTQPS